MTDASRNGDKDISVPARAMADASRARMLTALLDGVRLPSGELARIAGLAPSTASEHLTMLVDAGLVVTERLGRHRYYRLADGDVAQAVEALQVIAPSTPVRSLRQDRVGRQLRAGRTCYDHLAGDLGLRVTDVLVRSGVIYAPEAGVPGPAPDPLPTTEVVRVLGVTPHSRSRRPWTRGCLDWSGRRPHAAGRVGAAILTAFRANEWISSIPGSRAVELTETGQRTLEVWEAELRLS